MLKALTAAAFLILPQAVLADRAEDLDRLAEALGLPEIIEVMREEGLEHGRDVAEQMFPGRGGESWRQTVSKIYDADRMRKAVERALDAGLADVDLDPLMDFFGSDRGARIVGFEVSARRALMDDDIEAAAEDGYAAMRAEQAPRLDLLRAFVEANDLVASNVEGAMNSNYAFYQGLADGDGLPSSMTETDILNEVWAQEAQIRADTETWVYSYLAMAYQPLEDADIEAYIAISETEEGRALNRALFAGFDRMYNEISRQMGAAAARAMTAQDI